MRSKIDLHIHSRYSDGDYKINDLLERLKNNGISTFSIADHDNIKSYYELKDKEVGELKYISGVEISTYHNYTCFHILGYNYHGDIQNLEKLLERIRERRVIRAREMIEKIELKNNLKFNQSDIDKVLSEPSVGKKHVAKMMMENNIGSSYIDILRNYMTGLHLPTSYRVSVKEACDAIISSGGIPVLAHPKEYELRYDIDIEDYIEELIAAGIRGIEVYNSIHSKEDSERYIKLAHKYNLVMAGGSDFHGETKSKIDVGEIVHNIEDINEYEYLDILDKID